jgi:DeoR/GlpR family transcriptional regulator of sugar metabolism
MKPEARRERIATLVKEASRVSVDQLAALLDTSRETVRRDLTLLSEQGLLRKVHGGAVFTQTALESPLGDRRTAARAEKIAIGRAAAALFQEGDSLLIDSGSTTAYFAEALRAAGAFTVITNSLLVADELWATPQRGEVYLLGGRYFGDGHEVLGPLVVEQIQRLHADHAVLTIGAVDLSGTFMDFNADEAYVARAMIASARQVTVLADSSKLGRHALFQVCQASRVHRLVTDRTPADAVANALEAAGVEVIIAPPSVHASL